MHMLLQAGLGMLATAVEDAKQMETVLRTVHGFETCLLLDDAASKSDIERALDVLRVKLSTCASHSRFILFFAGHGVQVCTCSFDCDSIIVQTSSSYSCASTFACWAWMMQCQAFVRRLEAEVTCARMEQINLY